MDGASGRTARHQPDGGQDLGAHKVLRSASRGEDFVRTFAGAGVHNHVVAAVNSFANNYNYDVNFTCVTPTINILEPRQVKFALVGDPTSPIAFLARWTVKRRRQQRARPAGVFVHLRCRRRRHHASCPAPSRKWATNTGLPACRPSSRPAPPSSTSRVTLDGTISDTETDALLYVAPGNSDIALSFDASGSMSEEDIIGEGTRPDQCPEVRPGRRRPAASRRPHPGAGLVRLR